MFSLRWLGSFLTNSHNTEALPCREKDRQRGKQMGREWRTVTTTLRFITNIQPTDQNESPRVHYLRVDGVIDGESHTVMWPCGHWEQRRTEWTRTHCPSSHGTAQPSSEWHKIGLLTKKSKQQLLREEMLYRPIIMGLCFSIIMYTHTIQTSVARSK